jgi:putative membrane protein
MTASSVFLLALSHPVEHGAAAGRFPWTFEPLVLVSLMLSATLYSLGVGKLWRSAGIGKGISWTQAACFFGGWLALVAALVSPIDALSDQLLSVHMVQHELLMIVAAPLMAASSSFVAIAWLFRASRIRVRATRFGGQASRSLLYLATAPALVWLLHGFALWVWHLPSLYDAALENEWVHLAQHLCFFVSACLFWWGMLHGRYGRLGYGAAVIYVFATTLHSGVLGALMTMSGSLWYPFYEPTTAAWGLTPLEDQQLAGLIMWIPSSVIFLAVGLAFLAAWIRESERRVRILQTRA